MRLVRNEWWNAQHNVGFEFENDTFRLASYDWSDDEDENGEPIWRHCFLYKPCDLTYDWYKWAERGEWMGESLTGLVREAHGCRASFCSIFHTVIDLCIDTL